VRWPEKEKFGPRKKPVGGLPSKVGPKRERSEREMSRSECKKQDWPQGELELLQKEVMAARLRGKRPPRKQHRRERGESELDQRTCQTEEEKGA